jgi:hypothetical protein
VNEDPLTASGEIVFPIQCKEFLEQEREMAVEQKPAAVEETPAAKQSDSPRTAHRQIYRLKQLH